MKAHLLEPDHDIDLTHPLPANAGALLQDLELDRLLDAMAGGDPFLRDVAQRTLLSNLDDRDTIIYRQQVLSDCLQHPDVIRPMYALIVQSLVEARKIWTGSSPESVLSGSVGLLTHFTDTLKTLHRVADEHGPTFRSAGLTAFFLMLRTELDDAYIRQLEGHLAQLRFRGGVLMSASLGKGNAGTGYVLRTPQRRRRRWRLPGQHRDAYTFRLAPRDEAGSQMIGEIRVRGIVLVASAVAEAAEHVQSFMRHVQAELAFYVGCLNLHDKLTALGQPTCFPEPDTSREPTLATRGLYDPCLALTAQRSVVGNDVTADHRSLIVVTGANQGGKSTFLRSVGVAQLMMQSGMYVAAESFRADLRSAVFTHFRREEDASMRSGKLDEELRRMSDIADQLSPRAIILCNESFASTNEREGSEIGRQVTRALLDSGNKVVYVTHLYDLAHSLAAHAPDETLALRAERTDGGQRTFRLVEGEPEPTSYGDDLYRQIFPTAS